MAALYAGSYALLGFATHDFTSLHGIVGTVVDEGSVSLVGGTVVYAYRTIQPRKMPADGDLSRF
jgi:hypothetical protein